MDTLSPLVSMHHIDRSCVIVGKFFEILRSPTVASEPGLCVDVICTSRTQRVVGDNSHTAYQQRLTLISTVLLDVVARTDLTRTLMRQVPPTDMHELHKVASGCLSLLL